MLYPLTLSPLPAEVFSPATVLAEEGTKAGLSPSRMKRVTGIGGIFFKCRHLDTTRNWYAQHLGVKLEPWGVQFDWADEAHPKPYSLLSFFKSETDYFAPSESPFMINFRVADLDALVAALRSEGIEVVGDPVADEFGKFAWVIDPEGNKVELWEQPS